MNRIAGIALLLFSSAPLLAAPESGPPSVSGLWKVDGEVMGTPVRMMCSLTESDRKLSGTCSGAEDGYAVHKVAGTVKAQKAEFYFQTAVGGNPLTMIVSGTLNEDRSAMDGTLDVEPMAVGGTFSAVREPADATAAAVPPAVETPPEAAPTPVAASVATAPSNSTGTWKIDGDVQGTPVILLCVLTETDRKLTGTCTRTDEDRTPKALSGSATERGLSWHFDTEYQEQPITVSLSATLSGDGAKMTGTIAVAPLNAEGTFAAVRQ